MRRWSAPGSTSSTDRVGSRRSWIPRPPCTGPLACPAWRQRWVSEESAKGPVAEIIANVRSQYGFLPGVLIAFFNFSGRMEAAAGLPMDDIPATATPPEVVPDG